MTDVQSGPQKIDFPALGASWTGGGTDNTPPTPFTKTYSWTNAAPADPGLQSVTGYNQSNLTSTTNFTVTKDGGKPTGSPQRGESGRIE